VNRQGADVGYESQVDGSLPHGEWERLTQVSRDAGLYAIGLHEEYGGGLGHFGQVVVVAEQIARSVVRLSQSSAMLPLMQGTDEQRRSTCCRRCGVKRGGLSRSRSRVPGRIRGIQ